MTKRYFYNNIFTFCVPETFCGHPVYGTFNGFGFKKTQNIQTDCEAANYMNLV